MQGNAELWLALLRRVLLVQVSVHQFSKKTSAQHGRGMIFRDPSLLGLLNSLSDEIKEKLQLPWLDLKRDHFD